MILSVSRRTDIPAFYHEWFFNRIKEGYAYVRNPMNAHQISSVSLSRDVVDCIVFWTKNPAPMLGRLNELDGYDYYFQYTVNNYNTEIEPHIPPLDERLKTFIALSEKLGRERVIWRYDPIFFSDVCTAEYHLKSLSYIAQVLKDYTEKCVFSFVDVYPTKNAGSLAKIGSRQLPEKELDLFLRELSSIAKKNDLVLSSCAEKIQGEKYGITPNSCIDRSLIERITGSVLNVKPDGQRENCQCVKCEDIGSYDTCPHGCVYCYANFHRNDIRNKIGQYDAFSPLLCDKVNEDTDKISIRDVKSFKTQASPKSEDFTQLKFF